MRDVMSDLKECGEKGDLSGWVMMAYNIQPDGKVEVVGLGEVFGGAKRCMTKYLEALAFDEFSGSAMKVTYTIRF